MVTSKRRAEAVSAGILVWRRRAGTEYLLAHPGGPYWAKKDDGAWTVPKGLVEPGHDLEATARREFTEETGLDISGDMVALPPVKSASGKTLHTFAVEADLDLDGFSSNLFTIEWPPRSGRRQDFPEVDRISYFSSAEALVKITRYQRLLIEEAEKSVAATGRLGMKKGVFSGLGRTASKRVKRLQAAAAQTADELLQKSYIGTAEQTLRGAATMTKILHETDGDIAKAKSTIANEPSAKNATRKKPKRKISKRSAQKTGRKSGKR